MSYEERGGNEERISLRGGVEEESCFERMDAKYIKWVLILIGVACLLTIILVPISYSDLDYYEMGFKKSKVSGSVDTSQVYFGGRYFLGLTSTFKTFKADAHLLHFKHLTIYNQEKIEVTLTCSLQYILRPEDLKLLHDRFDINYQPLLMKTAASAIKNAASKYSILEYRLQRPKITRGLTDAVSMALGGVCCREDCMTFECRPSCKEYSSCNSTDKGLFADVVHFQLMMIDITDGQEQRFLRQVVEQELEDTEEFKQNETITRKKTEEMKKLIENEALEVAQNASASAVLLKEKAQAESKSIVEAARTSGLSLLYNALNISSEGDKKAIDYMRTLRNKKDANIYIGFSYMVANP